MRVGEPVFVTVSLSSEAQLLFIVKKGRIHLIFLDEKCFADGAIDSLALGWKLAYKNRNGKISGVG